MLNPYTKCLQMFIPSVSCIVKCLGVACGYLTEPYYIHNDILCNNVTPFRILTCIPYHQMVVNYNSTCTKDNKYLIHSFIKSNAIHFPQVLKFCF